MATPLFQAYVYLPVLAAPNQILHFNFTRLLRPDVMFWVWFGRITHNPLQVKRQSNEKGRHFVFKKPAQPTKLIDFIAAPNEVAMA